MDIFSTFWVDQVLGIDKVIDCYISHEFWQLILKNYQQNEKVYSKPQNHQQFRLIFSPPYNIDRMSAVVLSCVCFY